MKILSTKSVKLQNSRVKVSSNSKNKHNDRAEHDSKSEVGDSIIDVNEVGNNKIEEKKIIKKFEKYLSPKKQ